MRSTYKVCEDWDDIRLLVKHVKATTIMSHDFETDSSDSADKEGGLKYYSEFSYPTIISISFQPGSAWVIPLGHKESPFKGEFVRVLKYLGDELVCNHEITKVSWNTKFEYKWFLKYGIEMQGRCFDGMLAKHLLDEEKPHGLKEMVARFLPEFAGYGLKTFKGVDLKTLSKYGSLDADLCLRLFIFFETRLMDKGFYPLFRNLFTPLTFTLAKCEFYGIYVDRDYLSSLVIKYDNKIVEQDTKLRDIRKVNRFTRKIIEGKKEARIAELEDEISDLRAEGKAHLIPPREAKIRGIRAGVFTNKKDRELLEPINFGSPKQLIQLLYKSEYGFKLPILERTESGEPSTSEETILKLKDKDKYGFIDGLLELRGLQKLQSTYIRGILDILPHDNMLHSSYLIHGTVTGRLCVSQDCLIYTNRGQISIGDLIPLSPGTIRVDGIKALTHTGDFKDILYATNKGVENMYEVELENGYKIKCTKDHRFLTSAGWKSLKDIKNEDIICWKD